MNLRPGDRVAFRDDDGKTVNCLVDRLDGNWIWVELDNGCLWPLKEYELITPF